MSFVFTNAKRALLAGEIDFANDDIRLILVEATSTFGSEEDITTMGAVTQADYFDGSGHDTTNGHALDNLSVAADNTNDRGEFDADDEVLSSVAAGSNNAAAAVIFKWDTNLGNSIPIAFIDSGGFPFNGNGGDITFTWNAEGIIQAT